MRRSVAIAGSVLFFLLTPGAVAGLVPWWITGWTFRPPSAGQPLSRVFGALLIVIGLAGLIEAFGRFALVGRGTPAPIAPTSQLVVTGLYRHVRNPMYVAVVVVILGQAALFGDVRLVAYAAMVAIVVHLFVIGYEEPTLRRAYGEQYEAYCAHVPRWLPRFSPWTPGRGG
jgi:protein-S-isoprenylcysteine O-methyltransferase Ste14